ncbi:DUF1381 domain-containing protein [Staphylococcus cohnii]|uniref:DUF1381 domain-containing protein n=1 Tax=Staphylococcus cohnii TaxID=29382 RepID=UPI0032B7D218
MQFLVRKTHHTTDEVFLDATKAKENETFVVVDAENKEEAKEKVKDKKQCPRCNSWNIDTEYVYANDEPILTIFQCYNCGFKDDWATRKDSE